MKKQILGYLVVIMLMFSTTSHAQLMDGSVAPDFTATDINGTQWHLYDLLNQGKTVVLDVSAAWCSPCWRYHTSGFLESLYTSYGPTGTNEMMVFLIEGESTNTIDQLNGITTNTSYSGYTQGNWVTGTNYPIIDNATIANSYQISYFPTLYIICPDRMTRLMQQGFNSSGVATSPTPAQIYALRNSCSFATQTNDAGIANSFNALNGQIRTCSSANLSYRLVNYGTSPMTSADVTLTVNGGNSVTNNWTGTLQPYESEVLTFNSIAGGTVGNNTVDLAASNPNGQTDGNAANDNGAYTFSVYPPVGGPPVVEAYAATTFPPTGWALFNGGDAPTWSRSTAGLNGAGSAMMDFWSSPTGDVDGLQLPGMDLTNLTGATMTFDVSHIQYNNSGTLSTDNLKVKISINCGTSWTNLYNKSGASLATVAGGQTTEFTAPTAAQWRNESVILNSYIGHDNVFLKFEGTSNYGNNVFVDNVNVTFATGINTITKSVKFEIFPNPTSSVSEVSFNLEKKSDVTVEVFDKVGALVYQYTEAGMTPGERSIDVHTDNFAKGVYMVNIKTSEGSSMKKLVVE